MAVDDHGLEALKKSANQITPGDKSDYYLATKVIDSISGSFTFSGVEKLFKPTVFNVTDIEIKIPPSPDLLTQSFILVNHSEVDAIYIGETGVTPGVVVGVSTSGYEIPPGESFNMDFKTGSTVQLYAIAETGKTVKVQVLEVG